MKRTLVPGLAVMAFLAAMPATAQLPVEALGTGTKAGSTSSLGGDVALGARLVVHGLSAPLRWTGVQWATIPTSLVVLGAVSGFDDDVARIARDGQGTTADALLGAVEPLGDEYSFVVLGGLYAGGWLLDRPGVRRTAVEAAAASVVAAGVVTPLLKVVVGRARPRERVGPYRLDPFSGRYSFPSGHTTQAFALASVIAAESPHGAVDALAYGTAAAVGAARIYHDAHFLTDVLAGAAIGTVVGRTMVRRGRDLAPPIAPLATVMGRGEPVVGFSIRF